MDFPRTVDEITPEWLTQVLRESGAIRVASVESFDVEPIGVGMGAVGILRRLVLQFDVHETNAPGSIVAKFSPIEESKREFFKRLNTREYQFYSMFSSSIPVDSPRHYFSAMDFDSAECLLLLEDLSLLRTIRSSQDGAATDGAAVLTAVSRLHASSWNGGEMYDFLVKQQSSARSQMLDKSQFEENLEIFIDLTHEFLPSGIEDLGRKLIPAMPKLPGLLTASPTAVIHADLKTSNIFFDDSDAGQRVVLIDWQSFRVAKAAMDVGYFISTNFSTEMRRGMETDLFETYHRSLVDSGVQDYSKDQLMYDVRVAMLPRLVIRVNNTIKWGVSMRDTEEGQAEIRMLVGRLQSMIDWNCDEVIPK